MYRRNLTIDPAEVSARRLPHVRFTIRGMMFTVALVALLCATGWPPPSPPRWFLPPLMGAYLSWAFLDGIEAVRHTELGRMAVRPLVALVVVSLAGGIAQERRSYYRATAARYAGFARECEATATAGGQEGEIEVRRGCLVYHEAEPE